MRHAGGGGMVRLSVRKVASHFVQRTHENIEE